MNEPQIGGSDTLYGMLQRGRGQGFLSAIDSPKEEVASHLVECITNDPRWDRQVESRSDFYARLATHIALDLSPFEAHLFSSADYIDRDEYRTGLTIYTLADLARLGNASAIPLLRRYVSSGWNWEWAVSALEDLDSPEAFSGLGETISQRFGDDVELVDALTYFSGVLGAPGWLQLRTSNPRIDNAFVQIEARAKPQEEERKARSIWSTADLLRLSNFNTWRDLSKRTSSEDVELLVGAAREGPEGARSAALVALGHQNNDAVLHLAEVAIHDGSPQLVRAGRMALFRMKSDAALDKARTWLEVPGDLGDAALHILATKGGAEDIPALRAALEQARAEQDIYGQCDAIDGLGRLGDGVSAPTIESLFVDTTYSYLRRRAARALAAVSPSFPATLAIECLWDCEAETRAIAARIVLMEGAGVHERLVALAADPIEDASVRNAANGRLA